MHAVARSTIVGVNSLQVACSATGRCQLTQVTREKAVNHWTGNGLELEWIVEWYEDV